MKYFLGIDMSLNRSAFVIIDNEGRAIRKIILKNRHQFKGEKRLFVLSRFMDKLLSKYGSKLAASGVENYAYGARGLALFNIGEAGGVVRLALFKWSNKYKKHYWCFAPKTVKKYATGNGNSGKKEVIKGVLKKWKFNAHEDDDMADAYAVAQFTRAYYYYHKMDDELFQKFVAKHKLDKAEMKLLSVVLGE